MAILIVQDRLIGQNGAQDNQTHFKPLIGICPPEDVFEKATERFNGFGTQL